MDFIEKLLHVSPDAGNGTVEFVIYIVLISALVLLASRLLRRRRSR